MTSTLAPTASSLLEGAAAAVTGALTIGEPVTLGETESVEDFAAAIFVPFGGSASGEFAIFVDEDLHSVLRAAQPDADLTTALAPAIDAVVAALGTVAPGVAQAVEPRLAHSRIDGFGNSGMLALHGARGARAAVALGIREDAADPGAAAPAAPSVAAERLDLLRGVEMQASAELGRSRMTVNQLLNLRPGAVVELDRAAGDPADLYVNGRLMARGEVVVVDENYALRITHIVGDDGTR